MNISRPVFTWKSNWKTVWHEETNTRNDTMFMGDKEKWMLK